MHKKLPFNKVIKYFVFKDRDKLLYSVFLILSLFCFSGSLFSQTTLINPLTNGGFNLGNTFAANGWTVANEGTGPIKWTVGTAASGTTSVGTTTASSATVVLTAANANIIQGQMVYGTNIPVNTFVQSISGTTLTLSQNATASGSGITLGFGKFTGGISVSTTQLTTASIAANTYSVTLAAANPNISVGMTIAPIPGFIDVNTYVASINGTALGLSKASINGTALAVAQTLTFNATSAAISGNAAYVTNDNGVTNSYGGYSGNRTLYFYRDVTVPSAEKAITLTFDVKSAPGSGAGWQVWAAPVTQSVTGTNTQVTSPFTYGVSWPGATLISFNSNPQVATTKTTAFVPKSLAGTTFRLIFVWTNSSSAGTLPPAAIDNISLTSRIPEEITCAQSGLWSQTNTWDGGKVPTFADTVILDNDNEAVMIDSRYSGCEDLILAGLNTLVQYAISTVMDEFTINNDLNLAAGGARFNNHDSTNGKYLKLGHNLDVGPTARFDSSFGTTTAFQGRLTLNGSLLQTITVDPAGFMGGSAPGTNAFGNRAGVLNQLEVTNTNTATSNVIWNVNGVRINGGLILTSGRVSVTSGNRLVLGNFGSLNATTIVLGSGFTSGMISRWISGSNTKDVQPGTEYPGTDNNYKPLWYPFISNAGLDRSLYLLPEANPTTAGEVAVTYTDATTATGSLSIADGSYTINKRYNGNWAFSTPDSNAIPAGPALVYVPNATTPTNRVGVYANGGFEAIDGSSRLMKLSTAMSGIHQDGTAQPFVFRKGVPFADLTASPVYVGVNATSVLNTATGIVSAASGDWNTPSTWVGGVVPACGNVATIANGHNVTVTTTANAAGVIINKGGTLTNNAGATTMTVGCTNNNSAFYNYGTHTMTAGNLKVNGFVAHKTGSFFNQTGGEIIIDSNNNGDVATSVAFGGTSCKIETSNLALTGGKITIVDPLVNIGSPISATSIGNYTLNTEGATGTFTVSGSITGSSASMGNVVNVFAVGQVISGHANIPAGTTITAITVGAFGFPYPPVTLTLSTPVTAPVPAATPLNFSSMVNNCSAVVVEANATNANLAIGTGVSGPGIPVGTVITGINFNNDSTTNIVKITLSSSVTGLAISPIATPQTLTFTGVNPGSYAVILTAANPSIVAGMTVSGTGIKPGTFVTDVTGAKVTLSEAIQVGAPSPLVMDFYPFNTLSSGSFVYASPIHYAAGLNHTLQIGDGISAQNTSLISTGFNCQFQALGGLFSLGNLTVDAPDGNNRFMNVSSNNANNAYNMNVQNAFTVTAGSAFRKTFANATVYVGGNIINNGTINFPSAGTGLTLGNLINGTAVPTTLAQTISGSGIWETNQWSLTNGPLAGYALSALTINNANSAGVTLQVPNFRVWGSVTLTNGILHTSAANPIYCGVQDVMGTTYFGGAFSGGSVTAYVDGPCVHANRFDNTIGQLKLFPTGKNGKYLPILISSTGGVELMAEAFDTNSGTVNPVNGSNLSTNRWKVSRVGAAGIFTGYNVRLAASSSSVTASNVIVHAAADQGTYDIVSSPASAITFDAAHFSIPAFPSIVLTTPQTGGFLGNFSYSEGTGCTGTPTPGATLASSASVCSGQSTTLSLASPTTGAGVTYQWQSSVNGGSSWNTISGANAATYIAVPSVDTMYKCNVTCSASTGTSTPVTITVSASNASVNGASVCTSGTANLTASGSTILNWYDAASGGNLIATGTAYSPSVSLTTTYYVASGSESAGSVNTGVYTGTAASSALFKGIAFDVTNNIKLKTVTVYPKNTAALTPITIALFDAAGNVVSGTTPVTFTPTLVTGTVGTTSQVVTLNYAIPVGKDYRLVATYGLAATTNTLGNSTAAITYPTGSALKLTGNVSGLNDVISTTANATNCFHNLTYDEICESVRVPVTATVVNTLAPTGTTSQDTCLTGTIADFSVNGDSGATFTWYDAATSGNVLPTSTTAVANTTYYVSQTVNGCEGPRFGVFAQGPCLNNDDFEIEGLKYYPNPVTDHLTITAKNAITKVEFYNLLGQKLKVLDVNTDTVQFDFNGFAASTYLIKVYSEENVQLFKVVKK
ncbi:T9SS type A sorting domain-containing protein [Flavobacterium amniphilum]|uniref:T9SS type A sorting domain-containing protein n=1 Tax=Flavobacterium amniphilum TaxID=1834035 RepID=UPI00202A94EC|nr:T9SS type A sorting domain-containing protein [Flavobacterium amniphilum]MCL9805798.1 T9SS type A sorting domain-containing protein [Flavobacterium amniphilum]MCL9806385.1 T9SS type A sorting domain-containing protein [Flavobacterium amniphilum]